MIANAKDCSTNAAPFADTPIRRVNSIWWEGFRPTHLMPKQPPREFQSSSRGGIFYMKRHLNGRFREDRWLDTLVAWMTVIAAGVLFLIILIKF